jgi:hypothetical protein
MGVLLLLPLSHLLTAVLLWRCLEAFLEVTLFYTFFFVYTLLPVSFVTVTWAVHYLEAAFSATSGVFSATTTTFYYHFYGYMGCLLLFCLYLPLLYLPRCSGIHSHRCLLPSCMYSFYADILILLL